ncbi:MAG: hypothetical protein KGN79_15005 [Acidobacteriota bacterium]|nr:hypothetical protein [Acidobacteriota bacterium]
MQPTFRYFLALVVFAAPCAVNAQAHVNPGRNAAMLLASSGSVTLLPDAPTPQQTSADSSQTKSKPPKEPKRILGIMPNYRAVSAGTTPPPPTPKEAFKIATQNSFDYSSYVFVGITSLIAEGNDSHPSLGKGVPGFWGYSWRGFVDKADGNYWVLFILPTVFHEDERYFAKGEGSIFSRAVYSSSRVFVTPNYHGRNTFNTSEVLGRGIAEGISISYYPSSDTSASEVAEKYGYSILRDAASNTFREFWPDISAHLFHRHSKN